MKCVLWFPPCHTPLPWSSYPVDTQCPSIAGGICTVILAPLWRCLSMWWHCDSLKALQALFSKDRGWDLLSGCRRAEPSPSPGKEKKKLTVRRARAAYVFYQVKKPPLWQGNENGKLTPVLSVFSVSLLSFSKMESVLGDIFLLGRLKVHGDCKHDQHEITQLVLGKAWARSKHPGNYK